MGNDVKYWLDSFTPDQIEKMADEFRRSIEQEDIADGDFADSERFIQILDQIKTELNMKKYICNDEYMDGPLFGDVTNEEFIRVFCVLFNPRITNLEQVQVKDSVFEQYQIEYDEMLFSETHGQGTLFSVRYKE